MLVLPKLIVLVSLLVWMLGQCRKPSGPLGRLYLWMMNRTHSSLTDWGLKQLPLRRNDTILDVGCGGGRTVQKLATLAPEATVCGLDYSKASVAASRRTNAQEIGTGRVRIELGSVAVLPFPDQSFDIVTAVETHYYWPDLPANLREVFRVLKSGGTIAIIAEAHRGGRFDAPYALIMRSLRAAYLTADEHRDLLIQAGFADVSTIEAPNKAWICVKGRRAA